MRNWRYLKEQTPTIAGMLLFGAEPQRHLPFAKIEAACFPKVELGDARMDRKMIEGRLPEQARDTMPYYKFVLRERHEIREIENEIVSELPDETLREAIVNALVHRDHGIPGSARVLIFQDRVEVRSPGRPLNSINAESMISGIHAPRNPHLYLRMSELGLVTGLGSGIARMRAAVRRRSGKELEIEISGAEGGLGNGAQRDRTDGRGKMNDKPA
jgi:ATP-dependent DNA helicase RecG